MTDISPELQFLLFLQENVRQDWLNPLMVTFTNMGENGAIWALITVAMIICPKTRKIGIIAGISFALSAAVTLLLAKEFIERPRPFTVLAELVPLGERKTSFSFPSGHTVTAFAVAFVVLRSSFKKIGWSIFALAVLMGFSRLYVGAHYPTDVLGGIVLAFVGSYIAWEWAKRLKFLQKMRGE